MQELNVLRDLSEEIVKGRDPNISVLLGVRDMSLLQESNFLAAFTNVADPDPGYRAYLSPGSGAFLTRDPGWVKTGSGSGMNNPDERERRNNFLG